MLEGGLKVMTVLGLLDCETKLTSVIFLTAVYVKVPVIRQDPLTSWPYTSRLKSDT